MTHSEPFRRQPRTAPSPRKPSTEESELLAQLRGMFADFTDLIEHEAERLAGPLIESAAERARAMVAEAEAAVEREQEVNRELTRRLRILERQQEQAREAGRRLAAALGPQHTGRLLADLVTAAVAVILEARKGSENA